MDRRATGAEAVAAGGNPPRPEISPHSLKCLREFVDNRVPLCHLHIMNVRNVKNVIRLRPLCGATILSGARNGAQAFAALIKELPAPQLSPEPLFLDFEGIEVATASFLREAILSLKTLSRATRSSWYPVVANASAEILEELEVVCSARSDALVSCTLLESGRVANVTLVGGLDSKQREAYDFVTREGPITVRQFMDAAATPAEASLSPTAWNNRLAALVSKGLISELSEGRQKLYSPIVRCN